MYNSLYFHATQPEINEKHIMKCITVVGNCQAPVLAKLIKSCSPPEYEVNSLLLHRHSLETLDTLVQKENSIILSVPFKRIRGDSSFANQDLPRRYPNSRVLSLSNIYFEGYHPYWGYFYNSNGKKLYPEWDDYINYWIVHQYLNNNTKDLSSPALLMEMLNHSIYEACWARSKAELARREAESDSITNIADLLELCRVENKKLFWTCNHPSRFLFNVMAEQIVKVLGLDQHLLTKFWPGHEFLSNTILPTHFDMSSELKLTRSLPNYIFKGESISWEELVKVHFDFLSSQRLEDIEYSVDHYFKSRPELSAAL